MSIAPIALTLLSTSINLAGCVAIDARSDARSVAFDSGGRVGDKVGGTIELSGDTPVWPPRWGDDVPALGKGVIVEIDGPLDAWSPRRHGPWHSRVPKGEDAAQVATLARGRLDGEGFQFRMEGAGAFVFERDPDIAAPVPGDAIGRSEPAMMFVFVSGRPEIDTVPAAGGSRGPRIAIERTWFAFYDHRRGGTHDPEDSGLGTVMLLPGLFGIPEPVIDVVTSAMRQRGWNVIRMLAPPSRFVEQTQIELDPEDPASPAEAAGELMHRIAETAYAAQAAWDHVLAERPALADRPKVAFGGSGGALALPAVVRRDHARYDGAVLIAGGANILDVVSRSTYTEPVDALDFDWAGYDERTIPPADVLEKFTNEYLRHAPLDGYHAGEWFNGTPVLIMQASGDNAVPVENSELLWQRLGGPEKWTISGNHLTLFMSLWLHTPRILDWIDTTIRETGEAGASP